MGLLTEADSETERRSGQLKGFGGTHGDSELPLAGIRKFIGETSTREDKEPSCKQQDTRCRAGFQVEMLCKKLDK